MDAVFNDKDEVHPVNMPNAAARFPASRTTSSSSWRAAVTEAASRCCRRVPCPGTCAGSSRCSASTRRSRQEAAWTGTRTDAVRALCANPLVLHVDLAERVYDALAAAHRQYLPERLLAA